jgi:hypothetical protein
MYGQAEMPKTPGKRIIGDGIIWLLWRCMASPLKSRGVRLASTLALKSTRNITTKAQLLRRTFMMTSCFILNL